MRRDSDDPRLATMQGRLNYLFDGVRPAGKARYTLREVSAIIKRDQGFDLSAAYINQLCTGKRENPGVQQIQALAAFFGVPAGFLLGGEELDRIVAQIEQLKAAIAAKEQLQAVDDAMQDPGVRVVALKARGLSPSHLGLVSAVLDQVRQLEGLEHHDNAGPE